MWKEKQTGRNDFSLMETASHWPRTIFLSLSRASCKPPLVTREKNRRAWRFIAVIYRRWRG